MKNVLRTVYGSANLYKWIDKTSLWTIFTLGRSLKFTKKDLSNSISLDGSCKFLEETSSSLIIQNLHICSGQRRKPESTNLFRNYFVRYYTSYFALIMETENDHRNRNFIIDFQLPCTKKKLILLVSQGKLENYPT